MRRTYYILQHREAVDVTQPVGTLVKAMEVLEALGEVAPIGVLELSRHLGMDKSAVSRILTTFKSRDYVRVIEDGRYDLGLRLFELGQAMHERMPIRNTVIPHINAIARETDETAFAVHISQGEIAFLYDCVSTQDIRLGEQSGMRASPWEHPAGKAILAYLEEDAVLDELSSARRKNQKGLPTVSDLRGELASIRKQGYAVQRDAEKCLVSVPVLSETHPVNVALTLGGPSFRFSQSRVKSLAKFLIGHAEQVSQTLGWSK